MKLVKSILLVASAWLLVAGNVAAITVTVVDVDQNPFNTSFPNINTVTSFTATGTTPEETTVITATGAYIPADTNILATENDEGLLFAEYDGGTGTSTPSEVLTSIYWVTVQLSDVVTINGTTQLDFIDSLIEGGANKQDRLASIYVGSSIGSVTTYVGDIFGTNNDGTISLDGLGIIDFEFIRILQIQNSDPVNSSCIAFNDAGAGTSFCQVLALDAVLVTHTSAVPVPAAVWLFGSGLLGLIALGKRKHV